MLTQKQEAFALAYINTGNASEAYRQAYNVKTGKAESVHECACRVFRNVKVASRIKELQTMAAEQSVYTLSEHLTRLKELSEKSEAEAKFSEAIKAEELRGRASGFYTDKVEHSGGVGVNMTVDRTVAEAIAREFLREPGQ